MTQTLERSDIRRCHGFSNNASRFEPCNESCDIYFVLWNTLPSYSPVHVQENHDEDPEVTVSTAAESPEAQTVRQAVLGTGRKVRASVQQTSIRVLDTSSLWQAAK